MGWSDAWILNEASVRENQRQLEGRSGVYELGFVRNNTFYPKYVGRASCLYTRMEDYTVPRINREVFDRVWSNYNNVWVHWMRRADYEASEARMLYRHGIGRDDGLYEWNRRYEPL